MNLQIKEIKEKKLTELAQEFEGCGRCALNKNRTRIVFGEGNADTQVVFIGEGPGREEDLQGRPFVGKSGKLLSEAIFEVFHEPREHYYITNLVKCRAATGVEKLKDRPPEKAEIEACLPILLRQLDIIRPLVIVAIGSSAAKALLQTKNSISSLRGKWQNFESYFVMPTFHPSYILRNGGKTSPQYGLLKNDLELVKNFIKENN